MRNGVLGIPRKTPGIGSQVSEACRMSNSLVVRNEAYIENIKEMMSNRSRIIGYGRNGGYGERLPLLPLVKVGKESAIYILYLTCPPVMSVRPVQTEPKS